MPTLTSRLIALTGFTIVWISIFMRIFHAIYAFIPSPGFILTSAAIGIIYLSRQFWVKASGIKPDKYDPEIKKLSFLKGISMVLILFGSLSVGVALFFVDDNFNKISLAIASLAIHLIALVIGLYSSHKYYKLLLLKNQNL